MRLSSSTSSRHDKKAVIPILLLLLLITAASATTSTKSCDDVWNSSAKGHTCGSRIKWVRKNQGKSLNAAKRQIANEFPKECGPCGGSKGSNGILETVMDATESLWEDPIESLLEDDSDEEDDEEDNGSIFGGLDNLGASLVSGGVEGSGPPPLPRNSSRSRSSNSGTGGGGGVAFSFDDKYIEDWYSIRGMLNELGVHVTFFVMGYKSLTLEQRQMIWDLRDDGHEIAAHTVDHANAQTYGCPPGSKTECGNNAERAQRYMEEEVIPELEEMHKDGLYPHSFAYPYGAELSETTERLLQVFDFVRDTTYFPNIDAAYVNCPVQNRFVGAIGIDVGYNTPDAKYDEAMDKVAATASHERETLIFYGHGINGDSGYHVGGPDRLRSLLMKAKNRGLQFRRFQDLCT